MQRILRLGEWQKLGASSAISVSFLHNDSFDTDYGVGLIPSPLTADPGPGSSSVRDTGSNMSISGGELVMSNVSAAWGARVYHDVTGIARSAGLALLYTFYKVAADQGLHFGWHDGANRYGSPTIYADTSISVVSDGPGFTLQLGSTGSENGYQIAQLALGENTLVATARAQGWILWHLNASNEWDNLWVSSNQSNATIYRMLSHNGWDGVTRLCRVANLGLSVDWSASEYFFDATPVTLDTQTGNTDGVIDVEWTPNAGDTLELQFRRASGASYAAIRCNEAGVAVVGNTIELMHDGVQQSSSAFTFTNGVYYRIVVDVNTSTIDVYVNKGRRGATSASFTSSHNNTETGAAISAAGTIANWGMYPLKAEGGIATALNIMAA